MQIVNGTSFFYVGVRGIAADTPGIQIGFKRERRLNNHIISVSSYPDSDVFLRAFSGLITGCVWACVADGLAGSVSTTGIHYFGTLIGAYVTGAILGYSIHTFAKSRAGQWLSARMPHKKTTTLALCGATGVGLLWYRNRL